MTGHRAERESGEDAALRQVRATNGSEVGANAANMGITPDVPAPAGA